MISIDFAEKDIEDYLCKDSHLDIWFSDLYVIKRQYNIEGMFIDILAYQKRFKRFVVIELKKNIIDSQAFTQVLTYKTLMEAKFPNRRFTILLIAQNLDERLSYIMKEYSDDNFRRGEEFLYQLFDYDFENGISFSWFNKIQRANENKLLKMRSDYWESKYKKGDIDGSFQEN